MATDPHVTARLVLDTLPALMQALAADMRRMDHPMPMPHFRVLKMLQKRSMTVSRLAERSRVSLPTMSNTVTVLANSGWVERVADPEDRRKADLRITESGVRLVGEMEQHIVELISSLFSGPLRRRSPDSRRRLRRAQAGGDRAGRRAHRGGRRRMSGRVAPDSRTEPARCLRAPRRRVRERLRCVGRRVATSPPPARRAWTSSRSRLLPPTSRHVDVTIGIANEQTPQAVAARRKTAAPPRRSAAPARRATLRARLGQAGRRGEARTGRGRVR